MARLFLDTNRYKSNLTNQSLLQLIKQKRKYSRKGWQWSVNYSRVILTKTQSWRFLQRHEV